MTYEERKYRARSVSGRFNYFQVVHEETDLWIGVPKGAETDELKNRIGKRIESLRELLENFIENHPEFLNSFEPLIYTEELPPEVSMLLNASARSGTGPMAGIAGLFALESGRTILKAGTGEVLIENGGDIFALTKDGITVSIHAGKSPISDTIALRIPAGEWGICTSSGTVGHSKSFGRADAVAVVAKDPVLADTMATAIANRIRSQEDIQPVLDDKGLLTDIEGFVAIIGETMGIRGNLEIV